MAAFNNTTIPDSSGVPIFGYPGPVFYIIHIVAVCSCGVSTFCSTTLLIYLFVSERKAAKRNFYKWTKGERLVVYIAVSDLIFSVNHTIDHAYILAAIAHPVDIVCRVFAFFVISGFMGEWLLIFFSALSSFLQVVFDKNINMGRYDWRLVVSATLIPGTFTALGIIFKYIGPGGAWCVFDRNWLGNIMASVNGAILLIVFFTCMVCYFAIWIKITFGVSKFLTEQQKKMKQRSNRSGKVMMVFVAAYLIQWWPWAVQTLWSYFGTPELWIIVAVVFFCNIGGLVNALAYTVIRRKYLGTRRSTNNQRSRDKRSQTRSDVSSVSGSIDTKDMQPVT